MGVTTAMTLRRRAQRADEIVAERAGGAEWTEIAARHSISARQAQRIHGAGSARTPVLDTDPIELACAVLAEYNDALEDLRRLASETSHDGTKLGAIRGRVEVITLGTQLQMALGPSAGPRGPRARPGWCADRRGRARGSGTVRCVG